MRRSRLYGRGLRRFARSYSTVSYSDLADPKGWKAKVEAWDILEGRTLYSRTGPEDVEPVGVQVEAKLTKVVTGVPIVLAIKVAYSPTTDDLEPSTLEPSFVKFLSLTPQNIVVTFLSEGSSEVDELPLEEVVDDVAEDADLYGLILETEPRIETDFNRAATSFAESLSGLRGMWNVLR